MYEIDNGELLTMPNDAFIIYTYQTKGNQAMTLRECIIKYRQEHGLSQRGFAKLCGLTNGYISMIEADENPATGKRILPALPTIMKLAAGMNIPLLALIEMLDNDEIKLQYDGLTTDENLLLSMYRKLEQGQKKIILSTAEAFLK